MAKKTFLKLPGGTFDPIHVSVVPPPKASYHHNKRYVYHHNKRKFIRILGCNCTHSISGTLQYQLHIHTCGTFTIHKHEPHLANAQTTPTLTLSPSLFKLPSNPIEQAIASSSLPNHHRHHYWFHLPSLPLLLLVLCIYQPM